MFKNLSIRTKILVSFIPILILIAIVGFVVIIQINKISQTLEQNIPESIQILQNNSYLDNLAKTIQYYDEVLTQSARNYAFTEDQKWKNRYNSIVPELDKIIKEALVNGDTQDKEYFSSIDQSNLALVKMEEDSMSLVDEGRAEDAVKKLESDEYWSQKEIYAEGLKKYVAKRGIDYNEALKSSSAVLQAKISESHDTATSSSRLVVIIMAVVIIIYILLSLIIPAIITKPIISLKDICQKIAAGNFQAKAEVQSLDEIGQLATSFNQMYDSLQDLHASVEEKIQQRTAKLEESEMELKNKLKDVERANKLMIGRELKMVELKKEINDLKNRKN